MDPPDSRIDLRQRHGNPGNGASRVLECNRSVKEVFTGRGTGPLGGSRSSPERLQNLRSLAVVLGGHCRHSRVAKHRTVGGDDRHSRPDLPMKTFRHGVDLRNTISRGKGRTDDLSHQASLGLKLFRQPVRVQVPGPDHEIGAKHQHDRQDEHDIGQCQVATQNPRPNHRICLALGAKLSGPWGQHY